MASNQADNSSRVFLSRHDSAILGTRPTSTDDEKTAGFISVEPRRRRHGNAIDRADFSLDLDPLQILRVAKDYQLWQWSSLTFKDLPKFDDSMLRGLTQEEENDMIEKEIHKLLGFARSEQPRLFNSEGVFLKTNLGGVKDLSYVVDQIDCNLHIIMLDNSWLALQHCPNHDFYGECIRWRDHVSKRYGDEPPSITAHPPTLLSDNEQNDKAYHVLIDFIFGSTIWWLMRVAQSKTWRTNIIAVFARWAVKLKVIAFDPAPWAKESLAHGATIMRQLSNVEKERDRVVARLKGVPPDNKPDKVDFSDAEGNPAIEYYQGKTSLRNGLYNFVFLTNNIIAGDIWKKTPTFFHERTLIYNGGPDETPRQMFVDRHGNIDLSSNPSEINYSYSALELALAHFQRIPNKYLPGTNPIPHEAVDIELQRPDSKGKLEDERKTTDRLDDVISILVPLSLMRLSPLVESLFVRLRSSLNDEDILKTFEHPSKALFPVKFSLSQRPYQLNSSVGNDSDVIPTSMSPLYVSNTDLLMDTNGTTDDNPVTPGNDLKRRARETYNDYLTKGLVMKSWAVSEQSILVYCQTYSRICLAIASIIVFGSLSVPFLVGKRIQGVDPFQFVTFAWLLAGAFLVGAKGHYVTDWPWHDFLSGQVLCRSVSELADFCALNPQVVLFYLLHNEVRNPLVFRGPFVEPFAKRGESGTGFNVDVPLKHSTALGMGFVVLKVVWKDEEYLLIVDGRDEPVRDGRDVYASLEGNQSCSIKNKEIKPRNEEVTKLKRKEWKARNEGRGLYRVLGQYCNERKFG